MCRVCQVVMHKQITMILKSLMKQNEDLRDQLAAIEREMDEDD